MLVVMHRAATPDEIRRVVAAIGEMGLVAHPLPGMHRTAIGVAGNDGRVDAARLSALPGVREVIHVTKPYRRAALEWHPERTLVRIPGGPSVGGGEVVVMAGPCSVESEPQILAAARAVRDAGATVLRAGAFKPRSSPYAFQGLGEDGLRMLAKAREATGLPVVTEAIDPDGVDLVASYADVVQIGARSMQNYPLLKRAGRCGRPVLLKRAPSATIEELLLSAEYVLAAGNPDVILCERGVRGFDTTTRNLLDLSAVAVVHGLSHLPIVVDPSHGTGHREMVAPMARAAVAAGADGLLLEVHPEPDRALSDGAQSLYPAQLEQLMRETRLIAAAIGRPVAEPSPLRR
jgi:3-deoxy-7-phosphoheptulonate synthase